MGSLRPAVADTLSWLECRTIASVRGLPDDRLSVVSRTRAVGIPPLPEPRNA